MTKFKWIWIPAILVIILCITLLVTLAFGYRFGVAVYKPSDLINKAQSVTFNGVVEELDAKFIDSEDENKEYILCMYGDIQGDSYFINEVRQPNIELATSTSVTFEQCGVVVGKQFMGMIHSHIGGTEATCQQSLTDIYYFGFSSARIGSKINCVQCDDSTFGCYSPDSLWQRLDYKIINGGEK